MLIIGGKLIDGGGTATLRGELAEYRDVACASLCLAREGSTEMPHPDEFRQLADECLKRARETTKHGEKLALIQLAQDLIRAADEHEFPAQPQDRGMQWQGVFTLLPSPYGLLFNTPLAGSPGAKPPRLPLPGAPDRSGKFRGGR
jgi:hypothetical protein